MLTIKSFISRFPPLEPFEYIERAIGADPLLPDLLGNNGKMEELTAAIGAEVSGVQLSKLTDKGKDQLALLAAEKKVLGMIFRTIRSRIDSHKAFSLP